MGMAHFPHAEIDSNVTLSEAILRGVADAVNVNGVAVDGEQNAVNVRPATDQQLAEIDT
jgi:hypothetical protein